MAERQFIELHRRLGESWTQIARRIGRSASTAWREMRRNTVEGDLYRVERADALARRRRHQPRCARRLDCPQVCAAVERLLSIGWEPHLIARALPKAGSARTIYRAARGAMAAKWERLLVLPSKPQRQRKVKHKRIHHRVMIGSRSAHVALRQEAGHWEGDTIRPVAGSDVGLLVLVERKTRLVLIAILPDRSAATLNAAAARILKGFIVRSLTVDNGMEFASHLKLSAQLGAPLYFCNEHSPWERGTNEQTNKLIRYFIPKGSDIAGYTRAFIARVQRLLNRRPRRVLNYLSPEQSMKQVSPNGLCT